MQSCSPTKGGKHKWARIILLQKDDVFLQAVQFFRYILEGGNLADNFILIISLFSMPYRVDRRRRWRSIIWYLLWHHASNDHILREESIESLLCFVVLVAVVVAAVAFETFETKMGSKVFIVFSAHSYKHWERKKERKKETTTMLAGWIHNATKPSSNEFVWEVFSFLSFFLCTFQWCDDSTKWRSRFR